MGEPGEGVERQALSDEQDTAKERRFVCIEIGRLMDSVTQDQMIGTDLDLTAMVLWLAEYKHADPQTRERHAAHARRLIAYQLGFSADSTLLPDIETLLGTEETNLMLAEIEKLAHLGTPSNGFADATDEAFAYWEPVMDDIDFILDGDRDPYRFYPEETSA